MVLNYVWIAFFVIAFLFAMARTIFPFWEMYNPFIWEEIVKKLFASAELGFEISIGLTGVLALWMGIMKIGENGGAVNLLAKALQPLMIRLFPEVPKGHPAHGSMVMNFAANMLGLDNAATPLGLKAMQELQDVNPKKDTASNAMIMFLVLNTSGLTLIPVTIMTYRAQAGAASPSDIFLPILLSTFISSLMGLIVVSIKQKINLFNKTILAYLGSAITMVGMLIWWLQANPDKIEIFSKIFGNATIITIIVFFIVLAAIKKVNVYESFIEGAKEGFKVAISIIPYLIAMLVAIGVFRACGVMDLLLDGMKTFFGMFSDDVRFVDALPTAIMRPLSGGGARGLMLETMDTFGADSFAGRLSSVFQGTTETTFYVLAVYFGSVKIKNSRYAVGAGLLADLAGAIAAIFMAYLFFG